MRFSNQLNQDKTTLERAYELARSGGCEDVREIRKRLHGEGYDCNQLTGRLLIKQLGELAKSACRAEAV